MTHPVRGKERERESSPSAGAGWQGLAAVSLAQEKPRQIERAGPPRLDVLHSSRYNRVATSVRDTSVLANNPTCQYD
ncbi:hypothetical protein [Thermogemmatispora aurantia]|uniref:hypothetical protein n=1 Tax=Thermogemmatispora aurantia TaxID=2045279 RepID=UPI00124ECC2D|nr:hypothetical protein [Thermogemmatispora aurantia]